MDPSKNLGAILSGKFPHEVKPAVNGVEHRMQYFSVDHIYPNWLFFVKNITEEMTPDDELSVDAQEAIRKDGERAFSVHVALFYIITPSAGFWYSSDTRNVMKACTKRSWKLVMSRTIVQCVCSDCFGM